MITYITFAVETLADGQKIIAAVNNLDIKPHKMFYELPVAGQLKEDKPETVDKLSSGGVHPKKDAGSEVANTGLSDARPNVSPGVPLISKIGTATKEQLLKDLKEGTPILAHKYGEHMKLLWSRGEVKFDGKEYYL